MTITMKKEEAVEGNELPLPAVYFSTFPKVIKDLISEVWLEVDIWSGYVLVWAVF